ncbi:MAG: hypothetical protein KAT71_07115, partial [Gammaproteobacteria bacterium]|nr:hypothetical protein [Gammaproteobacteria bacterium]
MPQLSPKRCNEINASYKEAQNLYEQKKYAGAQNIAFNLSKTIIHLYSLFPGNKFLEDRQNDVLSFLKTCNNEIKKFKREIANFTSKLDTLESIGIKLFVANNFQEATLFFQKILALLPSLPEWSDNYDKAILYTGLNVSLKQDPDISDLNQSSWPSTQHNVSSAAVKQSVA